MKVERVQHLTRERFMEEFLIPGKPVIITDAMSKWDLEKFMPDHLKKEFGHYEVQVYNDLFDLQTIDPLADYLESNFGKGEEADRSRHYIRWYTKLKEVDFFWSDEIFASLAGAWQHPYFLPNSSLAVPFVPENNQANINEARFPYKGLFISGKGARTRLHRDPFNSNAVLCQFYGRKQFFLYDPSQAPYVMHNGEFVDIEAPDPDKFPDFSRASCAYEDILSPGEVILFPSGWFHDVKCLDDSISITWNFVHASGLENFCSYIGQHPADDQLEIVRFFLQGWVSEDAPAADIALFLKNKFSEVK
jgi:hypothetical protein